jgi:hypothetical protein
MFKHWLVKRNKKVQIYVGEPGFFDILMGLSSVERVKIKTGSGVKKWEEGSRKHEEGIFLLSFVLPASDFKFNLYLKYKPLTFQCLVLVFIKSEITRRAVCNIGF